jgi:hypothetical protein
MQQQLSKILNAATAERRPLRLIRKEKEPRVRVDNFERIDQNPSGV